MGKLKEMLAGYGPEVLGRGSGMIRIRNWEEIRQLPDSPVKETMEQQIDQMLKEGAMTEEDFLENFDGCLGGDWYLFELNDDPRAFPLSAGGYTDLLSGEWNWCDYAGLSSFGCFHVFWAVNNAGGPCLFVPDEPWLPSELRLWLNELIRQHDAALNITTNRSLHAANQEPETLPGG